MAFREGHTEYYADCGTNHVVNPLRGMRVFTTLANMCCDPRNYPDIKNPSILNAYNNGSLSPRWQQLIKTIQTMIRSKFTDLFFRNNWFQQSISIADDIDCVIECNNLTQLIAESLDDALENLLLTGWFDGTISIKDIPTFFPGDSDPGALDSILVAIRILRANTLHYCFHSMNNIYIVLDLPQLDIQNCVDITLEDYDILHNKRMQSDLDSQWRTESRMRSPRLPLEICELVINSIGGESGRYPEVLANLCLTCQVFLHYSHKHLYKILIFIEHKRIQLFFKSLSRWPHLRRLTTDIQLGISDSVKVYTEFFLHGRQALLPNLESLSIIKMPLLHPSLFSIRRPFHSVSTLKVEYCTFTSVLDLRRLIDSFFPHIHHLSLEGNVSFKSSYVNLPQRSSREPLLLQKFTLGTSVYTPTERVDPNPVILDWLKWTSTPTSLLFLRILAGHFFDMIPSFGRHIQFLNIMFNEDSRVTVEDKIDKISFGADVLPSLETLVVVLPDSGRSNTVRTFCKSLSRTSPSSTLSCVRVWTRGGFTSEGHKDLENALGQLPINVRIEMMDGPYWSKLGSKRMLYIPMGTLIY
ncbi:hypothetical protein C8Q75DRAFT_766072 [Abortiporus biennis]|nr:hypothetical protein C8Q75DRAFT_766072 [Abortiporus biennis]